MSHQCVIHNQLTLFRQSRLTSQVLSENASKTISSDIHGQQPAIQVTNSEGWLSVKDIQARSDTFAILNKCFSTCSYTSTYKDDASGNSSATCIQLSDLHQLTSPGELYLSTIFSITY